MGRGFDEDNWGMTVEQLIAALERYPADYRVLFEGVCPISDVDEDERERVVAIA